jgi:predicted double-glycine peptidase
VLELWIELILIAGLAFLGLLIGVQMSRLGKHVGLATCLGSVACVFLLAGLCRMPGYSESPILFAIAAGRAKLALLGFIVPLGLAAAKPYLLFRWEQWIVLGLIAISIFCFSVFPFLGSAVAAGQFQGIPPHGENNGFFRQSTSFTCGPAAAATALHRLGVTASESQLAILGRSCPVIGTTDYELLRSIETAAAGQVKCQYYLSKAKLTLDDDQVFLAILTQKSIINHCVAVLSVTDDTVVFADPAEGILSQPKEQFLSTWSGKGILISR